MFSLANKLRANVKINININSGVKNKPHIKPNKNHKPRKPRYRRKYRYYYSYNNNYFNSTNNNDADINDLRKNNSEAAIKAYEAKVDEIYDGDSFSIVHKNITKTVRLYGIDAPELGQSFYTASKDSLKKMIADKKIIIYPIKVDKYGRTIAKVYLYDIIDDKRKLVYVNYEQILGGYAWFYQRYALKNEKYYPIAEKKAQLNKVGIWSKPKPISPATFRAIQRKKKAKKVGK